MKRLKILIFTDWFDPAYKAGGPVTSLLNLTSNLSEDFQFLVFTGNREYSDRSTLAVDPDRWVSHHSGATVYYASHPTYRLINNLLDEIRPDVIYLNGMFSWTFSILPVYLAKRLSISLLIAPRGMLSAGSLGVKSFKKLNFLWFMKKMGLYRRVSFQATSPQENKDIRQHFGHAVSVFSAPNLPTNITVGDSIRTKEKGKLRMLSIARIAPEKNNLFTLNILAEIQANIEVDLVGPVYNTNYYDRCKKLAGAMHHNIKVNFLGELPHTTLKELIPQYDVFILPTTGENYGHSIVEALSSGLPVLISDQTPWQNLEEFNAGYALSLNNQSEWINKVKEFVDMDNEFMIKHRKGALNFAKEVINMNESVEQNRKMFIEAATIH